MALTLDQLQKNLDTLQMELGSATEETRDADGRSLRKRPIADILKAITAMEDLIRQVGGGGGSRVSFAQHKRGDGPSGPGCTGGW